MMSSNRPGAWSDEEDAILAREWVSGKTKAEIGLLLGRSTGSLNQRVKVLRAAGVPIAIRPIVYVKPVLTWERPLRSAEPLDQAVVFTDDPRAKANHGSPGTVSRHLSRSPVGCSAAYTAGV